MLNNGIYLRSNYTGDAAGNVSGGHKQGADYADELNLGADINMQTLAGIPGGALHVTVTGRTGRDISIDTVGNNVLANQIYGGQGIRLSELTWDQSLLQGRLDIIAGRMNDAIFGTSPINCNFMTNAFCGHVDSMFRAVGLVAYPYATWGQRTTIKLNRTLNLMIGTSEVNPKQSAYGRNDLNFTLQNDTGVVVPVELDYTTNFQQSAYPTAIQLGGYWDSSKYNDPPTIQPASLWPAPAARRRRIGAAPGSMPSSTRWSIGRISPAPAICGFSAASPIAWIRLRKSSGAGMSARSIPGPSPAGLMIRSACLAR
ncbi:carbohydrate porin [Acidocella sp. MX-AZ03]|nr:carbohydrate porin [Acidocella sp. MX-AZ03]WBO59271.1 carbohydrate porin [Acidocella sp. MX-AZ03]